jgi:mono/diheme cytochrome c family protein
MQAKGKEKVSNRQTKRSIIPHIACAMIAVAGIASVAVKAEDAQDRRAALGRTKAEFLWAQSEPGQLSGELLYQVHCLRCHKITGEGFQPLIPPLAKSDYFADNPRRLLAAVMEGVTGPITVNGVRYDNAMPPISYLTDVELALVTTYVLNKWGNPGGEITAEEVAAYRKAAGIEPPRQREPFRD